MNTARAAKKGLLYKLRELLRRFEENFTSWLILFVLLIFGISFIRLFLFQISFENIFATNVFSLAISLVCLLKIQTKIINFEFKTKGAVWVFITSFIYYESTAGDWVRFDRDGAFGAVSGRIFQHLPLANLSLSPFTKLFEHLTLTAPGTGNFDGSNITYFQGFPGSSLIYSIIGTITDQNNFVTHAAPLMTALSLTILFSLVCKLVKKKSLALGFITLFAVSIPMLYTGRTGYSENIILLLDLVLIYIHFTMDKIQRDSLGYWLITSALATLSLAIRIDAILTTWIPWLLYFLLWHMKNHSKVIKTKFIFVCLSSFCLGSYFIFLDYRFSPIYLNFTNAKIEEYVVIASELIIIIIFALAKKIYAEKNLQRIAKSLVILLLAVNLVSFMRSINFIKFTFPEIEAYRTALSALSWYFSRIILVILFATALSKIKRINLSSTYFQIWLYLSTLLITVYYGFDMKIAQDEPWASRRLVITYFILIGFWIIESWKEMMKIKDFSSRFLFEPTQVSTFFMVILLTFTLSSSSQYLSFHGEKGQSTFVNRVCSDLSSDGITGNGLVIVSSDFSTWTNTFQAACGGLFLTLMPSYAYSDFPDQLTVRKLNVEVKLDTGISEYEVISGFPFIGSHEEKVQYLDYPQIIGKAPLGIRHVFQKIYVGKTDYRNLPTNLTNGFYLLEQPNFSTSFAWAIGGMNAEIDLKAGDKISFSLPPCAVANSFKIFEGSRLVNFDLNSNNRSYIYQNISEIREHLRIKPEKAACQFTFPDTRSSSFGITVSS